MPVSSIGELPDTFNNLPDGGKKIAMEVLNDRLAAGDSEEKAIKKAWGAVKRTYKQVDDKWVKAENVFKKDIISEGDEVITTDGKYFTATLDWLNELDVNTEDYNHKPYIPFHHSEHLKDNTGFVRGVWVEGGTLYGAFDITDEDVASKVNKTVEDVSLGARGFSLVDGQPQGGYVHEVSITNDPFIKDQGQFVKLENTTYIKRGGDNVSDEKTIKGWIDERIAAITPDALKPDTKLIAELDASKTKVTELEGKVTELENVTKERDTLKAEKDTADAKATELEWTKEFDAGVLAKKVTPGEKESMLEDVPDPERLKAHLEKRQPNEAINFKGQDPVKKPGEGLTTADENAMKDTNLDPTNEEDVKRYEKAKTQMAE